MWLHCKLLLIGRLMIGFRCEVGIKIESGGRKRIPETRFIYLWPGPCRRSKLRRTQPVDSPTALVNRLQLPKRVRESG
jgi:hypothetical protein